MQLRLPTASHILSPGSSAWSSETGDEDGSEDGEGLGPGGDWGPASDGGADEDGSGDEDGGTPPQEEAVRRSGAPCPAADDAAAEVAVQSPRRPKRTVTEHAAPPRTCLCCVAQVSAGERRHCQCQGGAGAGWMQWMDPEGLFCVERAGRTLDGGVQGREGGKADDARRLEI